MKIYIHLANKSFFYFFLQNDPIKLGVGKYQCPFCPVIMSQNGTMKRHIMVHTGEKPFKCQLCQYASGRKASLQHHIQHIHGLFSNWKKFFANILSSLSCRMNQYNLAIINLRAHSVLRSWSWKQMWKDILEPIQEKNLMHANFAHIEAVRKELYSTTSNTFMEIFPIEKKLIFVVC